MAWAQYVVLGFAPGLFWLWILRRKDRLEPEPRALVLRVFAIGCLAPAVILLVRPALERLLPEEFGVARLLLDAFLVTAPCEELVKAGAMCAGILHHPELDEPLDGIVYGGAAALGFASVENVLYLAMTDDPALVVQRGFTATLMHLICTGALGLAIARARLGRRRVASREVALALLAVVVAHGAFDAGLLRGGGAAQLALLGVLPLALLAFGVLMRGAMRESREEPRDAAS